MKPASWLVLVGLGAAVLAGACGRNPPPPAVAPQSGPNADSIAAEDERRRREEEERRRREEEERLRAQRIADSLAAVGRSTEAVRTLLETMVHFDYDRANIRPDDAGVLDQKVAILQANPNLRIRIAGHCDERGSDEYNLALGNRRATAAKQYLVSHGVDAGRIEIVSYGEERPLASGHDEGAWAQNRRDEFEVLSGGEALRQP